MEAKDNQGIDIFDVDKSTFPTELSKSVLDDSNHITRHTFIIKTECIEIQSKKSDESTDQTE